jgi:LmbE family N-acetylglucosaminyl deacetylase
LFEALGREQPERDFVTQPGLEKKPDPQQQPRLVKRSEPPEIAASWPELVRTLPLLSKPTGRKIIVVAPHPDDETLGVGGLLYDSNLAGIDLCVLIVSDGGASHSHPLLVELRKTEALAATTSLGVQHTVSFLNFSDSALANHHAAIAAAIQAEVPTDGRGCVVLTTRLNDGHPDHDACARAGAEVAARSLTVEHWSYGVWTWTQAPCANLLKGAFRWPISPEGYEAKTEAIGMYASQVTTVIGKQIVTDELLETMATKTEVVWC